MSDIELPQWHEVSEKVNKSGQVSLSVLEQLIYTQEPAGKEQSRVFRRQLRNLIREERENARKEN